MNLLAMLHVCMYVLHCMQCKLLCIYIKDYLLKNNIQVEF